MKGIILAGGTGSRLAPLTKVTNKHLLPVGRKPMILHPLELLRDKFKINDIMIVLGKENAGDFLKFLGSGSDFNVKLTYRIQDEAGGIAQALSLCEDFAKDTEHVIVILGDNVFLGDFNRFKLSREEAAILLKEVPDPQRFGCAEVDSKNNIINIIEKPKNPPSKYAVTGIYIYPRSVFDIIKTLKPSARRELEITDVNNYYLKKGLLKYLIFNGEWTDAGTFESMHKANNLLFEKD